MPPLADRNRHQTAVYWEIAGTTDENEPTVYQPKELRVRWEDKRRQIVRNGTLVNTDSRVYTDIDLVIGSVIWLGELEDRPGTGFGDEDEELMEVVGRGKIPDVKGRQFHRYFDLMRFKGTLPAVVD